MPGLMPVAEDATEMGRFNLGGGAGATSQERIGLGRNL